MHFSDAIYIPVWIQLIITIPSIITAIMSAVNHGKLKDTQEKLQEVGSNVNGRLTEYLDLTRKSAYAQGVEDRRKNVADVASTGEIQTQKAEVSNDVQSQNVPV